MPEFDEYQKIKLEVENNVMTRLHPILLEIQTGQNNLQKAMDKLTDKVEPVVVAYKAAQKFGKFADWITKNVFKIILFLGSIAAALLYIKEFLNGKK